MSSYRTSLEGGATFILITIFTAEFLSSKENEMYAKLSFENRILERMRALEISADFLCALAGIPPSRLSQAFRSIKPLSNSDGLMLISLLSELEALAERAKPFPVAFRNPSIIKALIKDSSENKAAVAAQ